MNFRCLFERPVPTRPPGWLTSPSRAPVVAARAPAAAHLTKLPCCPWPAPCPASRRRCRRGNRCNRPRAPASSPCIDARVRRVAGQTAGALLVDLGPRLRTYQSTACALADACACGAAARTPLGVGNLPREGQRRTSASRPPGGLSGLNESAHVRVTRVSRWPATINTSTS